MSPLSSRDRTDLFEDKVRLLRKTYASGRRDEALSLAESIKDTIEVEKQRDIAQGAPDSGPDHGGSVGAAACLDRVGARLVLGQGRRPLRDGGLRAVPRAHNPAARHAARSGDGPCPRAADRPGRARDGHVA